MILEHVRTGRVLLTDVEGALDWRRRLRGLMGRTGLAPGAGMFFPDCRAIHTFFMRMAIDVIFLDSEWRVAGLAENLKPWRMLVCEDPRGRHTLETGAGSLSHWALSAGDALRLSEGTRNGRTNDNEP